MNFNNTIIFQNNIKEEIVKEVLQKDINEEGYIIDKRTQEAVLSSDGSEVNIEDFGGFENGSEIFIKKDIVSLMDYCKK